MGTIHKSTVTTFSLTEAFPMLTNILRVDYYSMDPHQSWKEKRKKKPSRLSVQNQQEELEKWISAKSSEGGGCIQG